MGRPNWTMQRVALPVPTAEAANSATRLESARERSTTGDPVRPRGGVIQGHGLARISSAPPLPGATAIPSPVTQAGFPPALRP